MFELKPENLAQLVNAAMGKIENDLVFVNCKVLNVFTKEFLPANVYVYDKWISHVEYDVKTALLPVKKIYDGRENFSALAL